MFACHWGVGHKNIVLLEPLCFFPPLSFQNYNFVARLQLLSSVQYFKAIDVKYTSRAFEGMCLDRKVAVSTLGVLFLPQQRSKITKLLHWRPYMLIANVIGSKTIGSCLGDLKHKSLNSSTIYFFFLTIYTVGWFAASKEPPPPPNTIQYVGVQLKLAADKLFCKKKKPIFNSKDIRTMQ